jgi:hypothetical protein
MEGLKMYHVCHYIVAGTVIVAKWWPVHSLLTQNIRSKFSTKILKCWNMLWKVTLLLPLLSPLWTSIMHVEITISSRNWVLVGLGFISCLEVTHKCFRDGTNVNMEVQAFDMQHSTIFGWVMPGHTGEQLCISSPVAWSWTMQFCTLSILRTV